MATAAVETELVQLEHEFWDAMKDKDVAAAVRLTDDPCIVTGGQGVGRINIEQFRKMMTEATWTLHSYEMTDMQTRMLTDDVAIVAYKVTEKLTVDGKPLTMEASDSSTWIRRDGEWKCALHTEAVTGDPFGRDRVKDTGAKKPDTKKK